MRMFRTHHNLQRQAESYLREALACQRTIVLCSDTKAQNNMRRMANSSYQAYLQTLDRMGRLEK